MGTPWGVIEGRKATTKQANSNTPPTALLAFAQGLDQHAIHVDACQVEECRRLPSPNALASLVDEVDQRVHVGSAEASTKIARGGRIGKQREPWPGRTEFSRQIFSFRARSSVPRKSSFVFVHQGSKDDLVGRSILGADAMRERGSADRLRAMGRNFKIGVC
jgi:hypothetical protein